MNRLPRPTSRTSAATAIPLSLSSKAARDPTHDQNEEPNDRLRSLLMVPVISFDQAWDASGTAEALPRPAVSR
jgi:hypothetical protein